MLILALAGSTCSGQGRYLISGPEDLFSIHVPYQTVRLDNGLEIVLNEDHRTPIVAINLAYRVGWKDDPPGKTSLAHLYEHLMYLGSAHVAEGTVSRTLEKAGAFSFNARTAADSTVYWETVPANQLEVALWLESDRMGFLADSLNQHKLDQARSAVANEVVQRFEDADYGGVTDFVSAQLFPASHPYHGGRDRSEINTITLDDIRQFGQTYYIPNNASLTLSGDFDLAKTVALVDRYFGSIRPGKPPSSQPAPAVALGGDKFLRIAAAVPLNAVMIAWPTPAFGEAGDADLDVIAYTLRQATLPHAMMSVEPLASWVWARQYSQKEASVFLVVAKLRKGISHESALGVIDTELQRLRTGRLGYAWTEAASSKFLTDVFLRTDTTSGRAAKLNSYNLLVHNPGYFSEEIDRYRFIRPEDLQATMNWQLPRHPRVVAFISADPKAPPGGRLLEVR